MIWQLAENKDWASLEKQFSWLADMQFIEQHKIHHAEGNVAIHTQMVLNELQKLSSFRLVSKPPDKVPHIKFTQSSEDIRLMLYLKKCYSIEFIVMHNVSPQSYTRVIIVISE